ncbi:unnamed protein product [Phytophthora fragariaefolia]|uniref:Unnamed protein product n=1 Tax=Phytophthora fragariaefolia TaxID=1490495 RepID=A0A9W6TTE1_9STRA|nr:unnamed protein product [Phytophthora fragariaefolia]
MNYSEADPHSHHCTRKYTIQLHQEKECSNTDVTRLALEVQPRQTAGRLSLDCQSGRRKRPETRLGSSVLLLQSDQQYNFGLTGVPAPNWERERQEYEDAIEARCAATGEDKSKALRSVKNSFNRELLKTLCKFEWGTTVEIITEDRIVSELDNIIGNVMNDVIVDIDVVFDARLKMDLRQRDVKSRVITYLMLCDEIIMEHGLASTFATATGIKEKCRILKKHLAPAALRDAVDTHIGLVDSTSKSDENALYALVK